MTIFSTTNLSTNWSDDQARHISVDLGMNAMGIIVMMFKLIYKIL